MYSLYGEHRKPTPEMFADIDVLFVDLIDVGTRVYTFIWTLVYCMEAAAEMGKKIVVLDRPNPIGGDLVEGNVLDEEYRSFVGFVITSYSIHYTKLYESVLCTDSIILSCFSPQNPCCGENRQRSRDPNFSCNSTRPCRINRSVDD